MPVEDPESFSGRLKKRSGLALNQNLPFMNWKLFSAQIYLWKCTELLEHCTLTNVKRGLS